MIARAARGFLIGALATIPMTGVFWFARRVGLIDELPPHKAVRSVTQGPKEPGLSWMAAIAHLLIGGGAGALYGIALPARLRGALSGAAFGTAVWAAGYEIVMPAATEMPPAHTDDRRRVATILIAHLVFGAVLGSATKCTRK